MFYLIFNVVIVVIIILLMDELLNSEIVNITNLFNVSKSFLSIF